MLPYRCAKHPVAGHDEDSSDSDSDYGRTLPRPRHPCPHCIREEDEEREHRRIRNIEEQRLEEERRQLRIVEAQLRDIEREKRKAGVCPRHRAKEIQSDCGCSCYDVTYTTTPEGRCSGCVIEELRAMANRGRDELNASGRDVTEELKTLRAGLKVAVAATKNAEEEMEKKRLDLLWHAQCGQ